MTLFKFARLSAWRKPLRALLLMLTVAIAFTLFGVTASFLAGSQGTGAASDGRLVATSRLGRGQVLPQGYLGRIAAEPGVESVAYSVRLRGFVGSERNAITISAVDPALMAPLLRRDLALTPDLLAALEPARDRVLVGRAMAEAQGWSSGQRIAVTAFDRAQSGGSRIWSFEIGGIFDGMQTSTDTYFVLARYDHVNALRARGRDSVDGFMIKPKPGLAASMLGPRIDALFANSSAPTRTQSEKQFLEAFVSQIADIASIVTLVIGSAFVTLLMIVANSMAFAIRERRFEIGLLKTLGFSQRTIMGLVLGETLVIVATGCAIGLGVAFVVTLVADPALGLAFTPDVLAKGAGFALTLGLTCGLWPAMAAMHMPVVHAFRPR